MSKRRHGAGGAFDALVRAFAGLGADAGWARLPRATAPGSLGRTLGQGVLKGRLPKDAHGACAADASPLPLQALHNEAQRSIAELGAILWHALGGAEDAPELTPWLERPHSDPTVALSLSRRLLAEYATPEIIDRTCAFPGRRVWLLEIERAHGEIPGAIAVWRSRGGGRRMAHALRVHLDPWTGRLAVLPAGDGCPVGRRRRTCRGRRVRDWTVVGRGGAGRERRSGRGGARHGARTPSARR